MTIAIPVAAGKLAMHFGHCESFALFQTDDEKKTITARRDIEAPPHQPGLLPRFLAEQGTDMIIAGGMGQRAKALFAEKRIQVVTGAPADNPVSIVNACLAGTLETGENACDH